MPHAGLADLDMHRCSFVLGCAACMPTVAAWCSRTMEAEPTMCGVLEPAKRRTNVFYHCMTCHGMHLDVNNPPLHTPLLSSTCQAKLPAVSGKIPHNHTCEPLQPLNPHARTPL